MSGFYQNWLKVQNPDISNNIIPMESGGYQTPFYFGGSQVPNTLGMKNMEIKGEGINSYSKTNFMPHIKGKGVQSSQMFKQSNIHMPRHMGSLNKNL